MRFANPEYLFAIIPVLALLMMTLKGAKQNALGLPSLRLFETVGGGTRAKWRALLPWLRVFALTACVIAIARPQWGVEATEIFREGIAISTVLDISTSMGATDLELSDEPSNRLEVVKATFRDFLAGDDDALTGREGDLVGMVTFARFADAASPMTLDHTALGALVDEVELVPIPEEDGTAIGDGIMLGITHLERATGKSRVMIVLTDGSNNAGSTEPLQAAQAASALGIKIYTIGAGSQGLAMMPVPARGGGTEMRASQVFIDEFTLTKVAELTGGQYFRATDAQALRNIYSEIDRLEKGKNVALHYQRYIEGFWVALLIGLTLLAIEVTLSSTRLRTAP